MWVHPTQFSSAVRTNVDFFCRVFGTFTLYIFVSINAANSSDMVSLLNFPCWLMVVIVGVTCCGSFPLVKQIIVSSGILYFIALIRSKDRKAELLSRHNNPSIVLWQAQFSSLFLNLRFRNNDVVLGTFKIVQKTVSKKSKLLDQVDDFQKADAKQLKMNYNYFTFDATINPAEKQIVG